MEVMKQIRLSGHARENVLYRGAAEDEIVEVTVYVYYF